MLSSKLLSLALSVLSSPASYGDGSIAATTLRCRQRELQPYKSTSIWNTPIGDAARLVPAGIFATLPRTEGCQRRLAAPAADRPPCHGAGGGALKNQSACEAQRCCFAGAAGAAGRCVLPAGGPPLQFHIDLDWFVATTAADPLTAWHNQGAFGCATIAVDGCAKADCTVTGPLAPEHIHFPHDLTTASDGGQLPPGQLNNNAVGVLMPDRRRLYQFEPLYRCAPGSPILAIYNGTSPYPMVTDITGDGLHGAHGGSGMSAVGGTIRSGELNPGAPPIPHALKLELAGWLYYFGGHPLNPKTFYNKGATQYRWPATRSDIYTWDASSPLRYNGTNPALVPGSLLAVPASAAASLQMQTEVGRRLLAALRDYGGYVVDDTASVYNQDAAIVTEPQVEEELRLHYNISLSYPRGASHGRDWVILLACDLTTILVRRLAGHR
jgi:hypothetical protein